MAGLLLLSLILVSVGGTAWPLVVLYGWTERRWPPKHVRTWRTAVRAAPFAIMFLFAEPLLIGSLTWLFIRFGLL
jgi:hypothetical protein